MFWLEELLLFLFPDGVLEKLPDLKPPEEDFEVLPEDLEELLLDQPDGFEGEVVLGVELLGVLLLKEPDLKPPEEAFGAAVAVI